MREIKERISFQFKEGHWGFTVGRVVNKYSPDSQRGREWQRGFDRAYFDHLDKISSKSS